MVLVAHNARGFDVPFLIKEFSRCSFDIPPNWLFVDTLPLAREVMKSGGLSTLSKFVSVSKIPIALEVLILMFLLSLSN